VQLTKELVDRLFEYKDGLLYWKERPTNSIKIGSKVGTIRVKSKGHQGYWATRINKVNVYNHVIVFFIHNGYLPPAISFINGNTLDYSIENLVERTRSELIQKGRIRKDNTSGYKGVSYSKRDKKWLASISKDNKRTSIGSFSTKEEASKAYLKEELKLYGENNG
jgi:hypothetical protein